MGGLQSFLSGLERFFQRLALNTLLALKNTLSVHWLAFLVCFAMCQKHKSKGLIAQFVNGPYRSGTLFFHKMEPGAIARLV